MDDAGAVAALRRCRLFDAVSDEGIARLARGLRKRRFRRGEVIFHQGDPGEALHIVTEGSVKIVLESVEGDEAILVTLGRGDPFGELALLDGAPRSASAVAVEASETMSLGRPALRELMDVDRALRDALFAGVAGALRRLTQQIEELHFLDLSGRLATRLGRLARASDPEATSVTLDWPYTQTELAAMIGGARQTVNRLLSELVEADLVRLDGDTLVIPDVDALLRAGER
jgi:CRP/FNR family transcriptional regulator, cyclic AMP receptor protein